MAIYVWEPDPEKPHRFKDMRELTPEEYAKYATRQGA